MLFRILLIALTILIVYYAVGALTTYIMRIKNPLKKRNNDSKTIYLTFDDGVNPVYTPKLLDLLHEQNIKATFFVIASTLKGNEDLAKRIKDEGHVVGLHSYSHKNQILQSPFGLARDFKKSLEIFYDLGIKATLYRPPWGHVSPIGIWLCNIYKLKTVLWNVIVQDWQEDTTPEIIVNKLRTRVRKGAVICLHDGRGKNEAPLKTTLALEVMIPLWKGEGYTFETMDTYC